MNLIKLEACFDGAKANGMNCRRLMDKSEKINNNIRNIYIEMNEGTISDENINMYCDNTQTVFYRDG